MSNTIVFPSFKTQATAEVPSHLWKYIEKCGLDQHNGHVKFETHCFFSLHLVQHSFCFCLTRFVLSTWKRQQMTLQFMESMMEPTSCTTFILFLYYSIRSLNLERQQMNSQFYAKHDGAELAEWEWIWTAQTFDSTGGEKLTSRQLVIW